MAMADGRTTPSAPRVVWEADEPWLRCVVGWPGARPPLSRVLPIFEHLGLVLVDHRPEAAADSFCSHGSRTRDSTRCCRCSPRRSALPGSGTVDRDQFASLVVEAHLQREAGPAGPCRLPVPAPGGARRQPVVRARDPVGPPGVRPALGGGVRAAVRPRRSRAPVENMLGDVRRRRNDQGRVPGAATGTPALLDAVTRTNYFRARCAGRPPATIVLKLDPARLPFATDPARDGGDLRAPPGRRGPACAVRRAWPEAGCAGRTGSRTTETRCSPSPRPSRSRTP